MTKISKEGQPDVYVSNPADVNKHLPDGDLIRVEIKGRKRFMYYDDGIYTLEPSNKIKGVSVGDICSVCGLGLVIDSGGCATCSLCNAQLKCGL